MGRISDAELVAQLHRLNQEERGREAELLLYLGELDARRFYRMEACSSAFEYCVCRLGYSEDVAWKRVGAARLTRRFPRIYELLSEGRIHLSALMLLKPHLNDQNQQELLLASCNKTKRQVEQLIAARYPKPDIDASVRKLPDSKASNELSNSEVESTLRNLAARKASLESTRLNATSREVSSESSAGMDATSRNAPPTSTSASTSTPVPRPPATPSSASSPAQHSAPSRSTVHVPPLSPQSRMVPLSTNSYRVTFTASDQLKQKLDRASELPSHCVRLCDLPTLIERAIDQLLEREEKRRFGASPRRMVAAATHDRGAGESTSNRAGESTSICKDAPLCNDNGGAHHCLPTSPPANTPMHTARHKRLKAEELPLDPDPVCSREDHASAADSSCLFAVPLAATQGAVVFDQTLSAPRRAVIPAETLAAPQGAVEGDDKTNGGESMCVPILDIDANDTRRGSAAKTNPRARVPVAVRRAVFERDAGQCSFVDRQGRRCNERHFLELDHIVAHAIGGTVSVDNLRLRCRVHNRLAAEQLFGPVHMTSAIRHATLLRR